MCSFTGDVCGRQLSGSYSARAHPVSKRMTMFTFSHVGSGSFHSEDRCTLGAEEVCCWKCGSVLTEAQCGCVSWNRFGGSISYSQCVLTTNVELMFSFRAHQKLIQRESNSSKQQPFVLENWPSVFFQTCRCSLCSVCIVTSKTRVLFVSLIFVLACVCV